MHYIFIIKSYTEYKHKKQIKEIKEKLAACNILNNTVNLLQAKPWGGERYYSRPQKQQFN